MKIKNINRIYIIVAIFYIAFVQHLPLTILASAVHDDALFMNQAINIISGQWLGIYNQMTLAKGPAYSLFLALNWVFGLPINLFESLFYLLCVYLLSTLLAKISGYRALGVIIYLFLLFIPEIFPVRVIRDNLNIPIFLMIVYSVLSITYDNENKSKLAYVVYGIFAGFFWINREDAVWIFPGILVVLILSRLLNTTNIKFNWFYFKSIFSYYILGFFIVIFTLGLVNYYSYNAFVINEINESSFKGTLNRLNSIVVDYDIPYVSVSKDKRNLAFKYSPQFSRLKEYFDNQGLVWTKFGCLYHAESCGDYGAGWFLFALRDGVALNGFYSNPTTAREFYKKLNEEMDDACSSKKIICSPSILPLMPKISHEQFLLIPSKFVEALRVTLQSLPSEVKRAPSAGSQESIVKYAAFLGSPKYSPSLQDRFKVISGWYYSDDDDWIELRCMHNNHLQKSEIKRMPSNDVADFLKKNNAKNNRFSLKLSEYDNCKIFNIKNINNFNDQADHDISVGRIHLDENYKIYNEKNIFTNIENIFVLIYNTLTPIILMIGFICYIISLCNYNLIDKKLFIISTSLLTLYVSRLFLVVLVDVSSFPAINSHYLGPAYPVTYLFSFLSFFLAWPLLRLAIIKKLSINS